MKVMPKRIEPQGHESHIIVTTEIRPLSTTAKTSRICIELTATFALDENALAHLPLTHVLHCSKYLIPNPSKVS